MEYFYARNLATDDNQTEILNAARKLNIDEDNIVVDSIEKEETDLFGFRFLLKKLRDGDVLYVPSLLSFGYTPKEIALSIRKLANKRIRFVVLDVPELDIKAGDQLYASKLAFFLNVLDSIDQACFIWRRHRQLEGVRDAKKRNVRFGRPRRTIGYTEQKFIELVAKGTLTMNEAAKAVGVSYYAFRRIAERYYRDRPLATR